MKNLLIIVVVASLTSILIPTATCNTVPPTDSEIEFNWGRAFGQAVMDWAIEPGTEAIRIEVDWSAASWGLGAEILMEEPINLRDVATIEFLAHTNYNTPTKIYVIVATPNDANLSFSPKLAYPVTSVPSKFTFPVDKLVKYKPEADSKNFGQDDWHRVDRIKFILTKPTTGEQTVESIIISKPQLVYRKMGATETRREEPGFGEATSPSEITHFQSLEELMARYPSDDSVGINVETNNHASNWKLILDKISAYDDCLRDWSTMDDGNKLFFDVNWKSDQSGFEMDFGIADSIEASGEWRLIFAAQTLDRSNPRVSVIAYNENERNSPALLCEDNIILKDRWMTIDVPLAQKTVEDSSAGNRMINRIKVACFNTNFSLTKEDFIIIKDLRLVKR